MPINEEGQLHLAQAWRNFQEVVYVDDTETLDSCIKQAERVRFGRMVNALSTILKKTC